MAKKASKKKLTKKSAKKKTAKKGIKKLAAKKMTAKKTAPKKKTAKKASPKKSASKKTAPKKGTAPVTESLLKVGQRAPEFSALTETGQTVSLKDFAGKKLVLYFYPKDDTPGCTQESCDFRDSFTRVQAKGAIVLGVSRDSVESHVKFKTKYSLPFSLLSDTDGKICEAFGVWKEKSMYGRKYMGIERSTFILDVDSNGQATIFKVYPKVSVTGHVDQILNDLV